MAKDSIKEYGIDLELDLEKTKKKVISIENKIRKRYKLLTKLTGEFQGCLPTSFITTMLTRIKAMEENYVKKSKQTELKF